MFLKDETSQDHQVTICQRDSTKALKIEMSVGTSIAVTSFESNETPETTGEHSCMRNLKIIEVKF